MSVLLKEIESCDSDAAEVLKGANFCTDSEIKSLTRERLHELFPETEKQELRATIFEIINKQKSADEVLQEIRGFIPEDSLKDALTNNGVLVDYLHLLKGMKAQVDNVQSFLEAHIRLLEDIKANTQQKDDPGVGSTAKAAVGPTASRHPPIEATSYKSQDSLSLAESLAENQSVEHSTMSRFPSCNRVHVPQVMVKYKMAVTGITFDAHLQILDQVKSSGQQLNLLEAQSIEDCHIVFVFCPIVSRIGTDVESAMREVTDDKPVILVLMHHTYEPKPVATTGTWGNNSKIVQHFNIFYHERARGLITCQENGQAISGILTEVLKYGTITEPREYSASSSRGSFQNSHSDGVSNNTGFPTVKKINHFLSRFYPKNS